MSSLNEALIMGRLGQDPKVSHTANNNAVANLSIATSETWKDKRTGEKQESTEWHRVTVFGPIVDSVIAKYLEKGSLVMIRGRLQTRKWEDKEGNTRYTTEIIVSGPQGLVRLLPNSKGNGEGRGYSNRDDPPRQDSTDYSGGDLQRYAGAGTTPIDLDDDIPF